MISHPDLYEKLVASRQSQVQHEMQQIRLATAASQQRTLLRSTIGSLGKILVVLGSYLQQTGQQKKASLHTS